jgi:hypothetical protein
MKILFLVLLTAAIVLYLPACNNNPEPAVPSTKPVDSAMAAAPDTIKAISVDSVKR